jgi:hypothetical protein
MRELEAQTKHKRTMTLSGKPGEREKRGAKGTLAIEPRPLYNLEENRSYNGCPPSDFEIMDVSVPEIQWATYSPLGEPRRHPWRQTFIIHNGVIIPTELSTHCTVPYKRPKPRVNAKSKPGDNPLAG